MSELITVTPKSLSQEMESGQERPVKTLELSIELGGL